MNQDRLGMENLRIGGTTAMERIQIPLPFMVALGLGSIFALVVVLNEI